MTDTEKLAIAKAALRRIGVGASRHAVVARSALAAMHGATDPGAQELIDLARSMDAAKVALAAIKDADPEFHATLLHRIDTGGEMPRRSGT